MVRPIVPLISRQGAVQAALGIIDARGLSGLSIRALGAELGVNGASLYYHFENKAELEMAIAEWVLDTARVPVRPETDWRSSIFEAHVHYREALLRHPNAVPLLLRLPFRAVGQPYWDSLVEATRREGLPDAALAVLARGLVSHAIGSAILVQHGMVDDGTPPWAALEDKDVDETASFVAAGRAMLEGILAKHGLPSRSGARRKAGRSGRLPRPTR
ncbi:MAG TPA: TetR family transcriptional regulator [Acidimicrobiales bacterium]